MQRPQDYFASGEIGRLKQPSAWVDHPFMSCPCYRLRQAHRLLLAKGYGPRVEIQPDYPTMLRGVNVVECGRRLTPGARRRN